MSEVLFPRDAQGGESRAVPGLPPLDAPYDTAGARSPRPSGLSLLALTSFLAPLVGGPLGSVAAIVFGWAARREIEGSHGRLRGRALAAAGLTLGLLSTVAWGAALALGVWSQKGSVAASAAEAALGVPEAKAATEAFGAPEASAPTTSVPKETTSRQEGKVRVVDVGASVTVLSQELARQRAEASALGETVLVMTTRDNCEPCREVSASLRDPLMQTALAKVRLVRVDVELFKEDLDGLKMQRKRYPTFFLLGLDLFPRDAIDGAEWDEDVPENMAPVLGPFVRGQYDKRREPFQPIPGTGIRL